MLDRKSERQRELDKRAFYQIVRRRELNFGTGSIDFD